MSSGRCLLCPLVFFEDHQLHGYLLRTHDCDTIREIEDALRTEVYDQEEEDAA